MEAKNNVSAQTLLSRDVAYSGWLKKKGEGVVFSRGCKLKYLILNLLQMFTYLKFFGG